MKMSRMIRAIMTRVLDALLLPFVALSAPVLWFARRVGLHRIPMCRHLMSGIGVLPLRRHYYDPYVDSTLLDRPLDQPRPLPGLDMQPQRQLALLGRMTFNEEVRALGSAQGRAKEYHFGNGSFESGDAEFLYQILRLTKPRRVVEIGSGFSTLVARDALAANRLQDPDRQVIHTCIEPFEMPWLETLGVEILRKRVETVPLDFFGNLESGDLLFIDSSHVIRPQGDVLFEYLRILPVLKPGVLVHVHDVFTPRDYPREWVLDRMWLWNEQYLVETMLSNGTMWEVVAALNFLKHSYFDALKAVCPHLTSDREPGSFYLVKR
jgi:predicted O-methyltransferase YrrM